MNNHIRNLKDFQISIIKKLPDPDDFISKFSSTFKKKKSKLFKVF